MTLPAIAGDDPDDRSAALPGGIQGTDFVFGVPEAFLDRLLEGRPVVCEMQTKLDKQIIIIGHKSIHRIERLDMRICNRNVNSLPLL